MKFTYLACKVLLFKMENYNKPISEMTMADFLEEDTTIKSKNYQGKNEKIKKYRKQTEYGAKKYIKPWRTGTKSQQIPTKGNKKH